VLNIVISAKLSLLQDMQQGTTTSKAVAAATIYACLKFRSGKATSTNLTEIPDPFTA